MIEHIPQGWQCPVCGRVYSPTSPMCLYCHKPTRNEVRALYGFDTVSSEFKKDEEDK